MSRTVLALLGFVAFSAASCQSAQDRQPGQPAADTGQAAGANPGAADPAGAAGKAGEDRQAGVPAGPQQAVAEGPQAKAPAAALDFHSLDVCQWLPGEEVAAALGGRLADVRSYAATDSGASRCVYGVFHREGEGEVRQAYVIWIQPPSDFDELRGYQEDPVQPVQGLGDDGYTTFHPDTKRHSLYTVKRGKATVEVTGEDPGEIRKLAELALSRL